MGNLIEDSPDTPPHQHRQCPGQGRCIDTRYPAAADPNCDSHLDAARNAMSRNKERKVVIFWGQNTHAYTQICDRGGPSRPKYS